MLIGCKQSGEYKREDRGERGKGTQGPCLLVYCWYDGFFYKDFGDTKHKEWGQTSVTLPSEEQVWIFKKKILYVHDTNLYVRDTLTYRSSKGQVRFFFLLYEILSCTDTNSYVRDTLIRTYNIKESGVLRMQLLRLTWKSKRKMPTNNK